MERNNEYDKYFNEDMTPRQADITFFKLMKNTPEEDVKDLLTMQATEYLRNNENI